MQGWLADFKELGFKGFFKKRGWKVIMAFVLFYLVRDTILYILIPYLVVNNIIQCEM